jgi:hypothetical protein
MDEARLAKLSRRLRARCDAISWGAAAVHAGQGPRPQRSGGSGKFSG